MSRRVAYPLAVLIVAGLLLTGHPTTFDASATSHESITITRGALEPSQCGGSLTVVLSLDWSPEDPDSGAISLEESYPAGWTVTARSGGGSLSTPGKVKWFTTDVTLSEVQYTLAIPSDASGTFTFTGTYRDHNMASGEASRIVAGPTSVSVSCGDGAGTSGVTRQALPDPVCGAQFQVSLAVSWGTPAPGMILIEETYPAGWTASAPSNGGSTESTGQVKWVLTDPAVTTVHYTLTVPASTSGGFDLTGSFRDDSMSGEEANRLVDGDGSLQVSCGSGGASNGAEVLRDEMINPTCGDPMQVHLLLTWNDAEELFIEETYPAGWTVSAPSAGGSTQSAGQVKWFLSDTSISVVSYSVTPPAGTTGTAAFTGAFRDSTMDPTAADETVAGDGTVTITCPTTTPDGSVTRSIPTVCSGDLIVTLTVDPATDTTSWFLDETLPPGLSVSDITGGGSYHADFHQIKWVSTDGAAATVTYRLHVPESTTPGTAFQWFGEYRFHPVMGDRATITGADTTTTACSNLHPFDADGDCQFEDSELFALIDGWKQSAASDDALFDGIDAWKRHPASYCD